MVVLVGYATEHGSTREIGGRIRAQLEEYGHQVNLRSLSQVGDVDSYGAVIIGSAVHNQAWLSDAREFVNHNLHMLTGRPVWLFSVGMPGALPGPMRKLAKLEAPKLIADFGDDLHARDHRLFSGVIQSDHLPFLGRLIFRVMGCRYGDYREWNEIDAWTAGIARTLRGLVTPGSRPDLSAPGGA